MLRSNDQYRQKQQQQQHKLKIKRTIDTKVLFFCQRFQVPRFFGTCHIILSALDAIIYVSAVHYFQEFWA